MIIVVKVHLEAELDPVPRYGLKLVQGAPRYSKTPTRDHWHLNIMSKFQKKSKKKKSEVGRYLERNSNTNI